MAFTIRGGTAPLLANGRSGARQPQIRAQGLFRQAQPQISLTSKPRQSQQRKNSAGPVRCSASSNAKSGLAGFGQRFQGFVDDLLGGSNERRSEGVEKTVPPQQKSENYAGQELELSVSAQEDANSWEAWNEYFQEMDDAEDTLHVMYENLERAINDQDFKTAADLKLEMDVIHKKDVVEQVLTSLDSAVEEGEYEEAARLRDQGMSGLLGWWRGKSSDDDPYGHIMQVTQGFGRYTAIAFSPRDLDKPWQGQSGAAYFEPGGGSFQMPGRGFEIAEISGSSDQQHQEHEGTVVMEVFMRQDADGSLQHQACVLRAPLQEFEPEASTSAGFTPLEGRQDSGDDRSVTLTIPNRQEGRSFTVQVQVMPKPFADFNQDESLRPTYLTPEDEFRARTAGAARLNPESTPFIDMEESSEENIVHFDRLPASISRLDRNCFVVNAPHAEVYPTPDYAAEGGLLPLGAPLSPLAIDEATRNAFVEQVATEVERLAGANGMGTAPEMRAQLQAVLSSQEVADPLRDGLTGTVTYRRLTTGTSRTDPFTGLYMGAFGPHGSELLELVRTVDGDGDEAIVCNKVTGDRNVPAGEMTFRAKVGRKHRLEPRDVYPMQLGVVARYRGQGMVAKDGYKDPRWVEGEMLQFSNRASSVTQGAELGFVWSVPGERKYLILLNRINLE